MACSKAQLDKLRPYLIGRGPQPDGEWPMYCPLHEDDRQSAGLNAFKGLWVCHRCDEGGSVASLIARQGEWLPSPAARGGGRPKPRKPGGPVPRELDLAAVRRWHMALRRNTRMRNYLKKKRGLSEKTIRQFELGWDNVQHCYTIPIRAADGSLVNVRFYKPNDPERKFWSVPGHGSPVLFPMSELLEDPAEVIICEGELDAILTIQHGHTAVTRSGGASTWNPEWNRYFRGRTVYVCQDMDRAGQDANHKIARSLSKVAKEVFILKLPFDVVEKRGKDVTDYWMEDRRRNKASLQKLMNESRPLAVEVAPLSAKPVPASLLDADNASNVGKPLELVVTIKGRRDQLYILPSRVRFTCDADLEGRCATCPANAQNGEKVVTVPANDPMLLELIDAGKKQVSGVLKEYANIGCKKVDLDIMDRQSVEIIYGRPSVDAAPSMDGASDYKTIRITSAGRHDTMPNRTVRVVGALHPNPRSQANEFLAWEVQPVRTSIDAFEPDSDTLRMLRKFQPVGRQRPLSKAAEIARELSEHVTHIYGRPEMHALMDLAWHSALSFNVGNDRLERGWLDVLVVGDTRTGKSEAATRLAQHYGAGEVVACEAATFAGIIGGVQQIGSSWVVTWGAVPINDRRLVVLDEVGGLTREEIAKMSNVRSSGIADLHKIVQERTWARTRLIWLGNPRNGRMSDYTYGAQAIQPLIGNPEDCARFDLAMSVHSNDVSGDEINRLHERAPVKYDSEACHALIRWVWSRQPDQIVWSEEATSAYLGASQKLARKYIEQPPLVQMANIRYKIARVATALAGRTFSCDRSFERLIVTERHVTDAAAFMNRLYSLPSFGYADLSADRLQDEAAAQRDRQKVEHYLARHPGLAKFLRTNNTFRRQDVEEFLDMSREQANGMINNLWQHRMVRKETGDIRVEPVLHSILREVR